MTNGIKYFCFIIFVSFFNEKKKNFDMCVDGERHGEIGVGVVGISCKVKGKAWERKRVPLSL